MAPAASMRSQRCLAPIPLRPQGSHIPPWHLANPKALGQCSGYGGPVCSRELHGMLLVAPFQAGMFNGSVRIARGRSPYWLSAHTPAPCTPAGACGSLSSSLGPRASSTSFLNPGVRVSSVPRELWHTQGWGHHPRLPLQDRPSR